jgi:hypothetical protein
MQNGTAPFTNVMEGIFSEVQLQNRAWSLGTPTESATSNAQGPDLCPLYIAHRHSDALGPKRGTPSGR